jgi:hypothetical protein
MTGWMSGKRRLAPNRAKEPKMFFGWQTTGKYHLSRYPADCPIRPSTELDSRADVEALVERKRGRVHWWPPLPMGEILAAWLPNGYRIFGCHRKLL